MDNSIYWLISLRVQESEDFTISYQDWIFETGNQTKLLQVTEMADTYIKNHIPYKRFTIIGVKDLRVMGEISLRKNIK